MVFEVHVDKAPLRVSEAGTIYISKTRVTLETLIHQFHIGASPEQIIQSFDVLSLAEVYAVIAYYLQHKEQVDEYIRQQDVAAEEIRRKIEADHPEMLTLQKKLVERKRQQKNDTVVS